MLSLLQKQKKVEKAFIERTVLPVGVVPGEPADVVVTEATKSYVVLAWKPPVQRGHEGVMYYIEKVRKPFGTIHCFLLCFFQTQDIFWVCDANRCASR